MKVGHLTFFKMSKIQVAIVCCSAQAVCGGEKECERLCESPCMRHLGAINKDRLSVTSQAVKSGQHFMPP